MPPELAHPQSRSKMCLPWLPPKQHLYSLGGVVPKVTRGNNLKFRDSEGNALLLPMAFSPHETEEQESATWYLVFQIDLLTLKQF